MDIYLKAAGLTVIAVILWLVLAGYSKNFAVMLSLAVCAMLLLTASEYLSSILAFIEKIQENSGLNSQMLRILLASTGIGLISEIIALICNDAGNSAVGKALSVLSTVVILWNSLPVFSSLLDLIVRMLGDI